MVDSIKKAEDMGITIGKARGAGSNYATMQWMYQMAAQVKDPTKHVFGVDPYKLEDNGITEEKKEEDTRKYSPRVLGEGLSSSGRNNPSEDGSRDESRAGEATRDGETTNVSNFKTRILGAGPKFLSKFGRSRSKHNFFDE